MSSRKYILAVRAGSVVLLIAGAKFLAHWFGWEVISLNPLFSGVVAANVFLMGFLLSGVLSDYKESERLPGELSASLETLMQEARSVKTLKNEADVAHCLTLVARFGRDLLAWFYKKHRTAQLMDQLNELTQQMALTERWSQATTVARLKQEVSNLRRMITRIHTIRETSFISSGYLLADVTTGLLCLGLVLVKIEHSYEALFCVGVISFLMIYLLMLIRDLDNPFGYYEEASGEDVSLKPIEDVVVRLDQQAGPGPGADGR